MDTIKQDDRLESLLRRKYVARQPIFDRDREVVGYELLFRSGLDNVFKDFSNQNRATSRTLVDTFFLFDVNKLTAGKLAFINFTKTVLLSELATFFPKDFLVVELLETIQPDEKVIAACKNLKEKGYTLALDDFVFQPGFRDLMDYVDIVKVDFVQTPGKERTSVFAGMDRPGIKFLAEKVESMETFYKAKEMGYSYFQGFFFSKPVIVSARDIPSLKTHLLNLLNRIYQPEVDMAEIESIIKKDVSLAYKLIRFVNSASFGLAREVQSIMHVLNLLGIHELRKWISLVVLSQLSNDKPGELMTSSIVRARFCELIARKLDMEKRSPEFFLTGLFSLIDTFFQRPMEEILGELPLAGDVKRALTGSEGIIGDVLTIARCYERGDWQTIFKITTRIGLGEEILPELYFETINWANSLKIE